jgi:hypothetical protein
LIPNCRRLRGGSTKAAEVRRCYSNVDPEATMHAQLDDLLTATYGLVDERLRALTPQIERAINYLAFCSPG